MFDLLPGPVRNFIDAIFKPAITFLQMILDMLGNASLVVGRGINLNNYLSWFGYLPASWQGVVQSLLASTVLLAMLFLIRSLWDMYLKSKDSAQWW